MNLSTRATPRSAAQLLVLVAAVILSFAPRTVQAAAHAVPFRANLTTEFQSVVEFPVAHISVTGLGQALHMGRTSTVSTDETVDLITGDGTATYTLTAANGDTVVMSLEFTTMFLPTGVTFEGTYTVTGGTGRFARATGSGSASGSAMFTGPSGGVGSFAIDGTISR